MTIETIIAYFISVLGVVSIFRPILLAYLFLLVPVVEITLTVSQNETELNIFKFGSINIYATDFLIVIMNIVFLMIVIKRIVNKIEPLKKLVDGPINKAIFIYFIWEMIIGFVSYVYNGFYLQNVLRHLSIEFIIFIGVFIRIVVTNDQQKKTFYHYLTVIGVFLVVVATWRYFLSHNVSLTSSGTTRSISGNAICILMFPLCYCLFIKTTPSDKNNIFKKIIPLAFIYGIILAGHRSGMIVLILIVSVWYITKTERAKKLFIPIFGSLLLVIALVLPNMVNMSSEKNILVDLVKRFDDTFDMQNKTTTDRLDMWKYSIEILKDKPIAGVASYPVYLKTNNNDEYAPISKTKLQIPAHNMFVSKIIHEGILGLIILLYLLLVIFKQIIKTVYVKGSESMLYLVYFMAFIVFSLFNTTFNNATGKILFFLVAGFLNYDLKKYQMNKTIYN